MNKKIKVLLNWDTSRKDLFEPFISLKDDIEFVVLYNRAPTHAKPVHPFKEIYFDDFITPYAVLKNISPEKVVFFNINTFPQIALNRAAKNIGIDTYLMHHGIYSSDGIGISKIKDELGLEKKMKKTRSLRTFLFYFTALRPTNINELWKYITFPFTIKYNNKILALQKSSFDALLPTKFIQLSPYNARVTKEIYSLNNDDRFIYIGHPAFDNILQHFKKYDLIKLNSETPYFLLVDFPNTVETVGFKIVGSHRKNLFYKKLSAAAQSRGCRLKIKLHPSGYSSKFNYTNENIDLVYDCNIAEIISKAKICLSFYSTLLVPIIFQRKFCYVFDFGFKIALQDELVQLGLVKVLSLDNFTFEDFNENQPFLSFSEKSFQIFIERYMYYADGKSIRRLQTVLQN